jgi:cytochrome b subunit of formate dehydrogenase/nitrate/TMAO reductase-like tetraheme cytochrome c subunit
MKARVRSTRYLWHALTITLWLSLASFASAQEIDCAECHEGVQFTSTAHPDLVCQDCHTNVTTEHEGNDLESLTNENSCAECHGKVLRTLGRSVHEDGVLCIDCHNGPHEVSLVDDLSSAVSAVKQIKHCGGCHDTPAALIDGYLTSEHGKALLLSGLINAPSCSDCHGAHRILAVSNGNAPAAHANSPEMCGSCHLLLLENWKAKSAHGQHWQAGEEGPVCIDCHATHEIADPTTAASRLASADNCGGCHAEYLTTFRDGFHGKANDLGFVSGATCSDCHTPHNNLPADDPLSSVHSANLVATCGQCHDNVTQSFVSYDPHNDPTNPDDNYIVYLVWLFMTTLLIGVFAFFGVHDILWLQRSLVGVLRGEFDEKFDKTGQYVRRFSKSNSRMHVVIIVTFLLLALTGLPLKFHAAPWAQTLMNFLGGVDSSRFIHRVAAIGTFGYMGLHVIQVFIRWAIKKEKGLFWGPNSMVPQPKDLRDFAANIRYFLYFGERPPGDRWTYFEKFDYLAVFWGVMIIGLSGLMLWLPDVFTSFLPGWILNAAYVVHSDEALLATGFIFIFHFFHTHLRPESFPMDLVVFLGKMPLEQFKSDRALEYQRLVDNNELDDYLVDPPTPAELQKAYVWGTVFLLIGIALAIGIILALLGA